MELCTTMLFFLAIILLLLYLVNDRGLYWKKRGVPHDKPDLFYYGNLRGVPTERHIFEPIRELYRKYKHTAPFCGLYYFFRPAALILDLNLVKRILIKDFNNFTDRGLFHNEKDDPLSAHLFALEGVKWRQLRNKLSPTFTSGKIKTMFSTVEEIGERFVDIFGVEVDKSSVVEVKDLLIRFSTDIIGTCAYGIDCNSLKDPNSEFCVMAKGINDRRHHMMIMNFIRSFPKLALRLGLRIIPDHIHNFFMRVVRETVDFREKHGVIRNDFMNLMIEMKNHKTTTASGEVITGLTMNEMAAQAFVFYIGGFETSSSTMGFALYELAQNQVIQDRLRQETNEVFAKHNGKLTYMSMKDMQYMDQVIYETLRKYTLLIVICRQAKEDYIVRDTKYKIEKGTLVVIPADAIHHDAEIYPDPEVFNPDRFSPEEMQKRDQVTWLPFGDGPRNCIGLRFGKMQMRIGLALLVKNFRFDICPQTEVPPSVFVGGQILSLKNGINLRVERVS